MRETLFAFDQRNYLECQNAYRGARQQEYYRGDYSIDVAPVIEVRADRRVVGSASIIRLRSRSRLSFTRSWTHIQEDATDVAVLWFVKRGRLCISSPGGDCVASSGDLAVTRSMTPFTVECQTDDDGQHEVLHVVLPSHELRRFVPQDVRTGYCIPLQTRGLQIAGRLLQDLFDDPGEVPDALAGMLFDNALLLLADALKRRGDAAVVRPSLYERRLGDVLRYIDIHLSDSKLSIAAVAKGCGISSRYLSFLLKVHGTPFSTLVWDKRLHVAREWLAARPGQAAISEVAYKVGFKSAAHFSRMFKRAFGLSPRQHRASALPEGPQPVLMSAGASAPQ
jgi:AraC-like DNA-binding protein